MALISLLHCKLRIFKLMDFWKVKTNNYKFVFIHLLYQNEYKTTIKIYKHMGKW